MARKYSTVSLHVEMIAAVIEDIATDDLYINHTDFIREAVREKMHRRKEDQIRYLPLEQ